MKQTFDPKQRAKEKAASRAKDEADIAAGKKTPQELRQENSPFVQLPLTFNLQKFLHKNK